MSKPTVEQLSEMHEQIKAERVTRENLQAFLRNPNSVFGNNAVLVIDRTHLFNPAKFIGKGWSIEEQDERSLALSEVNLADIQLVTTLQNGEERVEGEEKLRRLKAAGYIRLDAKILQTLWGNKNLIPESWKGKHVYFDGTVLRSPNGLRYVLYLCWYGDEWRWLYYWLEGDWDGHDPSAVLAE